MAEIYYRFCYWWYRKPFLKRFDSIQKAIDSKDLDSLERYFSSTEDTIMVGDTAMHLGEKTHGRYNPEIKKKIDCLKEMQKVYISALEVSSSLLEENVDDLQDILVKHSL